MSIKKSVMFSDATVSFIRARNKTEDDIMWSQALNESFKALSWLIRESLPDLPVDDWEKIMNVYAGRWIEFQPPFRIASDIMDHHGALELQQLELDWASLAIRLHGMSQAQQYAIMEFVRVFWSHDWTQEPDFKSIITKIKAML